MNILKHIHSSRPEFSNCVINSNYNQLNIDKTVTHLKLNAV